jgi:hypothetical protein
MFPETFTLLQSEGYLMQHCFKSSLHGLRASTNAQPGPYYAAFFNYCIGLERLLKILLLLDSWHRERKFPIDKQLRQYGGPSGHNVAMLFATVHKLFPDYRVMWKDTWALDDINKDFVGFLADFANGSRYFNLDKLVGAAKQHTDNTRYRWQRLFYRAYQQDHPNAEPIKSKPDVPEDSMSASEQICHHVIMAAASPHICCRLVQLLVPRQELLIAIGEHVHKDDLAKDGPDADPSVPYMEEFLEFVTADESIIIKSESWPYLD